ncbi:MATE family efflux transporter [Bacteroides caecigallinarum]|uniref:MATE family efflux transporter n=1 Tax=Bacteroides caecigallinarum TaxID=1411144 RepID=UPI001F4459FD|nr:MATE family efflux transporter [Bacteroides caecigallinarum]MCF2581518.1 MATE family efflux transporter [Bacteroides caecigallinarum]
MYSNKEIWRVTYPILLGLLAQNIINVTDTAFLGHVGEVALGAAAMGGLLYICVYTVAFGFSIGSQILIARRNGEGNYREVGPVMMQGCMFSFLMAVVLAAAMYIFAGPLIRMLITSDTIYEATYQFFTWRIWGFIFAFLNVMFRAFYIGITNTKVLTLSSVVMALVNVVLDYGLVFGELGLPEMGVRGAALASVIAEASSLMFFLIYTYTKINLRKYGFTRSFSVDFSMVGKIMSISSFTMVQYFLSMAIWFVFFMALERLGQRELAIANIVRSVYIVLLIPVQALATTANTLVSNLIGAGGTDKVVALLHRIARVSFLIMVVCVILTVLFPDIILSVYSGDPTLISESAPALYVVCGAMMIASLANIYFNGISGTGNTQAALVLETGVLIFYAFYVVIVGMVLRQPVEICFTTEVVYYSLMLFFSIIYLKKAKWQNKKI